jgi:hypothetical protein
MFATGLQAGRWVAASPRRWGSFRLAHAQTETWHAACTLK